MMLSPTYGYGVGGGAGIISGVYGAFSSITGGGTPSPSGGGGGGGGFVTFSVRHYPPYPSEVECIATLYPEEEYVTVPVVGNPNPGLEFGSPFPFELDGGIIWGIIIGITVTVAGFVIYYVLTKKPKKGRRSIGG